MHVDHYTVFTGVGSIWGGAQAVGAESLLAHECGAALPACSCPHAGSYAALILFTCCLIPGG